MSNKIERYQKTGEVTKGASMMHQRAPSCMTVGTRSSILAYSYSQSELQPPITGLCRM